MKFLEKLKYNLSLTPFEKFIIFGIFLIFVFGKIYKNSRGNENEKEEANVSLYSEDNFKININKAPLESLILIPGIGEKIAKRIIEEREKKKFSKIEDLLKVKGIGNKKIEKIKDYVIIK
jgi:competence protein ComEA